MLRLLVDLLLGCLVPFLCTIFLMIQNVSTLILSTARLFTEFDTSPRISGFSNRLCYHVSFQVCQHLDSLKARLSQDLVFVVWSCGGACRPTHGLPCSGNQGDSVAKRHSLYMLVGVVTSCVLCPRVRGRVSRSCATENAYATARLEALFKLSVVTILRHLYRSLQHFCGLWVLCPTRHLVRHVLHLVRDLVEIFLLVVGCVAIRLVHANANLFLPR